MQDKGYNYLIGNTDKISYTYDINKRIDPDIRGCVELYDDFIEAYFSDKLRDLILYVK